MDDVTKLLPTGALGPIDRRQLLQTVGLGATSAVGLIALPPAAMAFATAAEQAAANKSFAVTAVNHLSYPSTDYTRVRDFYVDLLGMRAVWDDGTKCQLDCGPPSAPNSLYITQAQPNVKPTIAHFAFGLPNFWERSAELKAKRDTIPVPRPTSLRNRAFVVKVNRLFRF